MTSKSKHSSLWECITGTSKWSDYFNIPSNVSVFWMKNSENSNKSVLDLKLSEKLKDNNNKTLEFGGGGDKLICDNSPHNVSAPCITNSKSSNESVLSLKLSEKLQDSSSKILELREGEDELIFNNSPPVAHRKIRHRKMAIYNEFFQPCCSSETVDNRNKLSTTHTEIVNENKSFQKNVLHLERDIEIPMAENKICDLSDYENHTAYTKAKQENIYFKNSPEVYTESSTTVFCDKHTSSENWERNDGRIYKQTRRLGTELFKEVAEEKNKGDMLMWNEFRGAYEKKESIREFWSKSAGSTNKGMSDSEFHIHSEQPETTEAKEISHRVFPAEKGNHIDGNSTTSTETRINYPEVPTELNVNAIGDVYLAHPEEEIKLKISSRVSSPTSTQVKMADQQPPTESQEYVSSGSIHTPLEIPKEHLPKLNEHVAVSIGNDTPLKYPKEKSARTIPEVSDEEMREHADSNLEHTKNEETSESSIVSPSAAATEITDKGHPAKVEDLVDFKEPSEHSNRKNEIRSISIVDSSTKAIETTERKCQTDEIPLQYLKGEDEARSSSFIASSKINTAMKTTDEEHAAKLEENVKVGTNRASEYPNSESEVGSTSFVSFPKTTKRITFQKHPSELGELIEDGISNYTLSEHPKYQSELSFVSLDDSSEREITSDCDGDISEYAESFIVESTSEDESNVNRSSADQVGSTGAEEDVKKGRTMQLFSGSLRLQPNPHTELNGGLSNMMNTSDESIKAASTKDKYYPVRLAPSEAVKGEITDASLSPSSSSLRLTDTVRSSSPKGKRSIIRQASQTILRVNKLVRLIIFKKPKHDTGNSSSTLSYEMRGNCGAVSHNINRDYLPVKSNPNQDVARETDDQKNKSKHTNNNSRFNIPEHQREPSLLEHRSKYHNFPERKNEVNTAKEIVQSAAMSSFEPKEQFQSPERNIYASVAEQNLEITDMSNFQPKYQHQSYVYNVQHKPTRLIEEINTGTHNKSAQPKYKEANNSSFTQQFPIIQRKVCENNLMDYSATYSGQNVLIPARDRPYSNVYSGTNQPFSIVETLCDECRQK